ncbi:MAG: amidohydrolase [Deltaproteobacteria bacterium]|nr:amidohydrolase [Deltaproteobacteria bacterium]
MKTLIDESRALLPDIIALRRTLHRVPEVGLDLPETQRAVIDALRDLPIEIKRGDKLSSVIGVLDGARPGPTVLLRADMDALAMQETADVPFKSERPNAAHTCGHDAHTAMLVGAARLLAGHREQIAGRILFMFQPGEEGHDGARKMIDEGLLDGHGEITCAFAIHQAPNLPSGSIAIKSGACLAGVDGVYITVKGRGGHAGMPHLSLDPIPVACEIVQAIQSFITRRVDPFDPIIVTIAKINAGVGRGIISELAHLEGTMRSLSSASRDRAVAGLTQLAQGIASAHGMSAEVRFNAGYPVTVNHSEQASLILRVARETLGAAHVIEQTVPVMGSEDFAYVLERVPGAMAFLGTAPPGVAPERAAPPHHPAMILDEDAMAIGIAMHAGVALAALG